MTWSPLLLDDTIYGFTDYRTATLEAKVRNRLKSFHIDLAVGQRILALDVSMSNIDQGMEVEIGDKVNKFSWEETASKSWLDVSCDTAHKWHSRVSCPPRDQRTRVTCHTYIQTRHVVPEGCHP